VTGTVAVTAQPGCGWTAVSNDSWITITSGASGSGNGSVAYSVAANSGGARTGTVTIAGLTFTVDQAAFTCTFALSPTSASLPSIGGGGSVNVSAPAPCAWTAISDSAWLSITAGASGTGNGTVSYVAAPNSDNSSLTGTLTIGGEVFAVTQAAVFPMAITTTSLPFGVVDVPYIAPLGVTGGSPAYQWAITAGALPAGLALNQATGVISGTPAAIGDFAITVKVTDSGNRMDDQSLVITVYGPSLQLLTNSLPSAIRGSTYSAQLTAVGGLPPYAFSAPVGALPVGLELDPSTGVLSGIPAFRGTFTIPFTVTDQRLATVTNLVRLVIVNPEEAPRITSVKYKANGKLVIKGRNFGALSRVMIDGQLHTPSVAEATSLVVKRLSLAPGPHEIRVLSPAGLLSDPASLTL
jgi:hypothetical protein